MSARRFVVFSALVASFFSGAAASATPLITPQTLQCDGTYASVGTTHHPTPTIQALVQDTSGLRIGQARMGVGGNNSTRALWRFDANSVVSDGGWGPDGLGICPVNNSCWTFNFTYSDPNGSDVMQTGSCIYDSDGPVSMGGTGSDDSPTGAAVYTSGAPTPALGTCPNPGTGPGRLPLSGSYALFPGAQFGDGATFDGTSQFGSVTYAAGTWDRPSSYTLSAWVKSTSAGSQRIVSEQGAAGFWGFGLNGTNGLRLFDSRNTGNTDVTEAGSVNFTDGAWHKVDVVRNNGIQERFFADGKFIGAVAATNAASFASNPIQHPIMIGRYEAGAEYFKGQIDEIRVMDTALTDEEVRMEYAGSNAHRYATPLTGAYSTIVHPPVGGGVSGGLGALVNGETGQQTYAVNDGGEAITFGSSSNQRWIFEAQSTETVTTVASTFTITINNSVPSAPLAFGGVPSGVNSITWSWTAPTTFCPPPGSASVFYQMFDAVGGSNIDANLSPAGNIAYPALSRVENVAGTPNLLRSRRLDLTDVWGTGPLSASASAYTMAAVPASPAGSSVSTASFVVSWSAASNPVYTRYELTYTTDPSFVVGVATRVGIGNNFTGTSLGIAGLASGTTYFIRLRAFNGQAADFFGGVATAFANLSIVTVPPAPPIAGTPQSNSSIRWSWNTVPGAAGYTLYDTPTQAVLTGPNADVITFTSATLSVNTRYDVQVEADPPAPAPPSARGNAFTYTLANVPSAPSAAVFATSATFSWSPNGNPANTFYQVVVATDPAFTNVTSTLTVQTPTVTATGLLPGVVYYAEVQAINGMQLPTAYAGFSPTTTAPDPAITVSSSPASPYVAPTGLVGAWQFDENTGTTTADSSGANNTGNFGCQTQNCVSTPTFAAGPVGLGSAASFSGLAGGAVLTNSPAPFAFAGSLTVEAWVNPVTVAETHGAGIVAVGPQNSEDFALDVSPAGGFEFLTSHGGVETSITAPAAALVAGQWTHVAGVYDLTHASATLYVNGSSVAVHLAMPTRVNSGAVLAVGNRQDAAGHYTLPFAGRVDSVRVISGALTAAQVRADYQGGFVSSVTPPSPNNGVVVGLPPNAFGAPAQIFISADPVNNPIRVSPAALIAGMSVIPAGLTMVPNSLIEVVPVVGGVAFTAPLGSSATLTLPYKDPSSSGLISGTNPPLTAAGIQMYTLNTSVNSWVLLPTTVDKVNHAATGVTPHFSVFALFAPATVGTSLAGVRVFPVPWKPGSGGRFDAPGVSFSNLPASGTIRILTLGGRRVREISFNGVSAGTAVWDGQNDDGRRAASGVYFGRISSGVDGSTTLVKFAIER